MKAALIAGVITKPVPMPAPTSMAKPRSASSKAGGILHPVADHRRPEAARAQFAQVGRLLVRHVFLFVQVQVAA